MTELNDDGTKKRTSVYVGTGILAEQLVRPADDTHSTAWEDVVFKHQDIVTGGYNKTNGDGTLSTSGEPPARAELEPLGGRIPDNDPQLEDYGFQPQPLSSFKYFGDVGRSEYGCLVDGFPSDQCLQLLESGLGEPDRFALQPIPLGYWVDEQGPLSPPDNPENIPLGSVVTRFIPFNLRSLGYGNPNPPLPGDYIQDALDATKVILEGDSECAKWFDENGRLALKAFSKQLLAAPQTRVSGEDYLGIHQSTTTRNPMRYFDANDKQLSSNTTTAYRLFSTVEINSLGPFANPQSRGKIGSHNLRPATLESRIAQILHEVAHLAYKDYKPLIEDDKNDVAKSIANSNIVLDDHKCMDAISAYMRSVQPQ